MLHGLLEFESPRCSRIVAWHDVLAELCASCLQKEEDERCTMQQCDTVLDRVIHDHVPSVHHQRHLLMDADDTSPTNEGSDSTVLNSALFACSRKADRVTVVGNQSSPRMSGAAMELDQYHLLQDN